MKKPKMERDWLAELLKHLAELGAANARFNGFEARFKEAMKRIEDPTERRLEMRRLMREARQTVRTIKSFRPKQPRPKRPRPDEGGEPVPAFPRPKPRPLSGGAAAPIERDFGVRRSSSRPFRVKPRPDKVPSEADRSRFF